MHTVFFVFVLFVLLLGVVSYVFYSSATPPTTTVVIKTIKEPSATTDQDVVNQDVANQDVANQNVVNQTVTQNVTLPAPPRSNIRPSSWSSSRPNPRPSAWYDTSFRPNILHSHNNHSVKLPPYGVTSVNQKYINKFKPVNTEWEKIGVLVTTSQEDDTILNFYMRRLSANLELFEYKVEDENGFIIKLPTTNHEIEDGDVIPVVPGKESKGSWDVKIFTKHKWVYV